MLFASSFKDYPPRGSHHALVGGRYTGKRVELGAASRTVHSEARLVSPGKCQLNSSLLWQEWRNGNVADITS